MPSLILSLETSSLVCSVALHQLTDGSLVGQTELRLEKSHSSHLSVLVSQLLENSQHTLQGVAAVAVSDGRVLILDCVLGRQQRKDCVTRWIFR
ncbi:hypothetical protein [Hymenobacter volaticus]|uniref:tRNA (Adenosine(37)-N6)-threonylcarbamoyltransferase complex dimerization subunit type 1 TsaB n=1 Tax=Hymenobacter volaticus TaxID=2932254 RepID=A0ABY4G7E4_9BACT|nr:hypothetical protein [Hymenobacter volaticus]UOQ66822.1 hypothetical protein MUN86_02565 [Hymenobacter volaticus]